MHTPPSTSSPSLRATNKCDVPREQPASPLFFFTPYSSHPCISRSRITVTFTHMRIGSVIVKDAQIWQQESCKSCHRSSLKEKKNTSMSRMFTVSERERERKESYSSAFLIGLLWQPIGGQAALTAANQKKGLASQCCCSPKQ